MGNLFASISLFNPVLLSIWTYGYLFYILHVIIQYSFILYLKLSQLGPQRPLSIVSYVPFTYIPIAVFLFYYFLSVWHDKMP